MKLMHKYTLKDFAATVHILESLKISYMVDQMLNWLMKTFPKVMNFYR